MVCTPFPSFRLTNAGVEPACDLRYPLSGLGNVPFSLALSSPPPAAALGRWLVAHPEGEDYELHPECNGVDADKPHQ